MIEQTTSEVYGIEFVATRADGETMATGDLTYLGTMNLLETIFEGGAERRIETSQVGYVMLSIIKDRRPVEFRRVTGQTHVSGFAEMMQQKGYL